MAKNKIQKDSIVVRKMILIYCKHHLKMSELNAEYTELADYCVKRLYRCRWGINKPMCHYCSVSCYRNDMRNKIREVMSWVGPRMFFYAPVTALQFMLWRITHKKIL